MKRTEVASACAAVAFIWVAQLLDWFGGVPWWAAAAFTAATGLTVGLRYLLVRAGIVPRDQPPADRLEKILLSIVTVLLAYILAGLLLAPDPWPPSASVWSSWFGTRQMELAANAFTAVMVVLVVLRIRKIRRRQ